MNYTLHQLQVFLKVSQNESITKAAEELHLTQPAVSIQLKNFQNQFDIPLYEVIGRKIYITDFGKDVANAADKILNEVHAIDYKKSAFKGELAGKLNVSIVSTGKYVMPYFLKDFLSMHQSVELIMDVTNKSTVIEHLEKNIVDFALVSVLPDNMNIEAIPLLENKLYLIDDYNKTYKKKEQNHSLLEKTPMIFREQGSGTRLVMERFFKKKNLSVNNKLELTSNEAVKQAVIAGLGASIMPIIGVKNELLSKELQIVPIKDFPIESTWYLIYLKNKNLTNIAQRYVKFINMEKNRIIKDYFEWYKDY